MEYGQFCPLAKACELLGEKWNLLILRELMMGATRFSELQRGMSAISPTVLSKRLAELAACGIIVRKKIPNQKGYEYFLSEAGREVAPIISDMSSWGMRWARGRMPDDDLDLDLLILYLQRSIDTDKLIGNETVIRLRFTDQSDFPDWWLVATRSDVDVCVQDPAKEVDIYLTTTLRVMTEIWMGDRDFTSAIADKSLTVVGHKALTRNLKHWLRVVPYAEIRPAQQIIS